MRIYGFEGHNTSLSAAKNVLYIGAVDDYSQLAWYSSMGPSFDGRIFPTVVARGSSVYSTITEAKYGFLDGTSMACPTASGTIALLIERYMQVNSNQLPRADVMRAIVANTADGLGPAGPDFMYGFGLLNGLAAVDAIEQKAYKTATISQDGSESITIPVPEGAVKARVMLLWNDPVTPGTYTREDKVLINNLDLNVAVGGTKYLPLVPNRAKGHVRDDAKQQVDELNNLEQVTIPGNELKGQKELAVTIKGTKVTDGKQNYVITWYFEKANSVSISSPSGGETFAPGERPSIMVENLSQMPADNTFVTELSYDGGATFTALESNAKSPSAPYACTETLPADAPVTDKAIVRLRFADGTTVTSAEPFTIAPEVKNLAAVQDACSTGDVKLKWDKLEKAVHGYSVFMIDADAE